MNSVTCVCGAKFAAPPAHDRAGTKCPQCGATMDLAVAAEVPVTAEAVAPRKKGFRRWAWILSGFSTKLGALDQLTREARFVLFLATLGMMMGTVVGAALRL